MLGTPAALRRSPKQREQLQYAVFNKIAYLTRYHQTPLLPPPPPAPRTKRSSSGCTRTSEPRPENTRSTAANPNKLSRLPHPPNPLHNTQPPRHSAHSPASVHTPSSACHANKHTRIAILHPNPNPKPPPPSTPSTPPPCLNPT